MKPIYRWMTILCTLSAMLQVTDAATGERGPGSETGKKLQEKLDEVIAGDIQGVVLRISGPNFGTWTGAAGISDTTTKRPMRATDRFRAGSIMKILVATVTLQMVEEGRFRLDDPMTDVLPEDVAGRFADSDRITVRMLLNHTSGLPDWVNESMLAQVPVNPQKRWDGAWLDGAAGGCASFPPGTGWSYSNTNYNLLGMVIEGASGRSWRDEVRDRILTPLKLADTEALGPGEQTRLDGHARGYHRIGDGWLDLTEVDPSMAGAAGGQALVTTAEDLARMLDAVLAGTFFRDPGTLEQMLDFQDAPDESGVPHEYGLALEKYRFPGGLEIIGHSGGTAGYAALVFRVPGRNLTVSGAINTMDLESLFLKVLVPALDTVGGS